MLDASRVTPEIRHPAKGWGGEDISAWRSSPTGKSRVGRRARKCRTPKSRPGGLLCVWEPGGASLLITHSPGTALSQSLCRLLLPLQLWGGDEGPVIHSLD